MQSALGTPLDFVVLRKAEEDYLKKRHDPSGPLRFITGGRCRSMALPMRLSTATRFSRDNSFSGNELMAT
jgi:hypothetical protein